MSGFHNYSLFFHGILPWKFLLPRTLKGFVEEYREVRAVETGGNDPASTTRRGETGEVENCALFGEGNKTCKKELTRAESARLSGMNETLQAPAGGIHHNLSGKFYDGGQFMPAPDKLAGAKRKAQQRAGIYRYNAVEVIRDIVYVHRVIRDIPSIYEPRTVTRLQKIIKAASPEAAQEIASSLPPYGFSRI